MSRLRRTRKGGLTMEFTWRLPRSVVAWALIRAWAHATSGPWSADEPALLTMEEVVKRWSLEHNASLADGSPAWLRRLIYPDRGAEAIAEQSRLVYQLEKVNAFLSPEAWVTLEELEELAETQPVGPVQVAQYLRLRLVEGSSLEQAIHEVREPAVMPGEVPA